MKPEVDYTIHCEPEIDPYIGHFAYDTEAENDETEQWIREQLESGNEWAWCSVAVIARFGDETGEDHLSGCSYRSEEDFRGPGGYFDDMKEEALAVLEERIERAGKRAAEYFGNRAAT